MDFKHPFKTVGRQAPYSKFLSGWASNTESTTPVLTDPLAIFAYTLGEAVYQQFYRVISDAEYDRDQSLLYSYFMSGPSYSPILPDELNALIPEAQPIQPWRKFMCMLNDGKAAELCGLELDEWPAVVDQ